MLANSIFSFIEKKGAIAEIIWGNVESPKSLIKKALILTE